MWVINGQFGTNPTAPPLGNFDSLRKPSENCARCAHALLDALQAVHVHSPMSVHELAQSRGNRAYQIDWTSCGWHALRYIETEMRRFAGEGQ